MPDTDDVFGDGGIMAKSQENAGVFRNDVESSGQNPEKLNEYIRIGSTGSYFLIGALVLIVVVVLIWGFTGTIPVTTQKHGIIVENREADGVLCLVDAADNTNLIPEGAKVNFTTADRASHSGHVVYISSVPFSTGEVRNYFLTADTDSRKEVCEEIATVEVNEWMLDYILGDGAYHYLLFIASDEKLPDYRNEVVEATITTDEVHPISFLFK